jgi:hypothetical protein
MLINLPPRRVMAKASPTFGVSETRRFGGCIIPSDLTVATPKCGYGTVWYDHRADGRHRGIFPIAGSSGPVAEMGSPNLIMRWTNVAALMCALSRYEKKVVRSRCNLPDLPLSLPF